ncbi:MAG: Nramp family divalent metal transporter [Acidobacteria bacterium]|nr:Nramp family divalent metal transporter [Acidobacteriota bacterium]
MLDINLPKTATLGEGVRAGYLSPWKVAELPEPPSISWRPQALLGPGLLMVGASIGGGEWLLGPAMTAQYGATFIWIAVLSIILQGCYNLEVMRYTLYCGEPILLGCFRTWPGPILWTVVYLALDFGAVWPYLAANAAIPLTAAFLGHIPGAAVNLAGNPIPELTQHFELEIKSWVSYGIYLSAFFPLIFGGKVYNALERVMALKVVLVLGYLLFIGFWLVSPNTWYKVFSGLLGTPAMQDGTFSFRGLSALFDQPPDFALLATFAAIAGAGGLSNANMSGYCRDKGWGMGSLVGAIPSVVGGSTVSLSHTGKVFRLSAQALKRWQGWIRVIRRDQWGIWVFGCILGVAIPSLVSLEFIGDLGRSVSGDELAAITAKLIWERTGHKIFWWLTLLCGFLVLGPSVVSGIDGFIRRWTDIVWTAMPAVRKLNGNQVKYVYYGLMMVNGIFGLAVLILMPDPLEMVKVTGVLFNYALGFSAIHILFVNCLFLPAELRPSWLMRFSLLVVAVFFTLVSVLATKQYLDHKSWH